MKDFLWTLYELYAVLSITVITPLAIVFGMWLLRQVRREKHESERSHMN